MEESWTGYYSTIHRVFFYIILSCMDCRNLDVLTSGHRRRINTEEKTTVVAAVWGKEFIQFLAALAILHQDDFEE